MSDDTVAFVGGGNMTRAIVRGLLEAGVDAGTISISEPAADQRDRLTEELAGVRVDPDNAQAVATARVVVLAVKPQVLPVVCRSLADTIQASRPLIISIAAGVRSADIEQWLGGNLAVIRVMPNQPALLGLGASGIYANSRADADDMVRAERVMRAVGVVVPVTSEAEMDAVTAISGSGPAYFYLLIDMLVTSGIDMGLDATTARALAVETARGAAALAAAADESMPELITRVRSPGGTTAAALDSLEGDDVRAIFARALTAARDRAVVLADAARDHQDQP